MMEKFTMCTCGIPQQNIFVCEDKNIHTRPSESEPECKCLTTCSVSDHEDSRGAWSDSVKARGNDSWNSGT